MRRCEEIFCTLDATEAFGELSRQSGHDLVIERAAATFREAHFWINREHVTVGVFGKKLDL